MDPTAACSEATGLALNIDAKALADALRKEIEGDVRFDDGSRALYATDASNYRQVPIGVVLPKTKNDIVRTVALARQFGAPILSRGAGTSLAGQCCNVAVIIDMSRYYNRLLSLNAHTMEARVQPGIVLDHLRNDAMKQGATFGPDPATHSHCTLGGMMGNNSCGVHAQMAGKTVDNVLSLEILTYDGLQIEVGPTSDADLESIIRAGGRKGELYQAMRALRDRYADEVRRRFPKIPRRVSGYNLDGLLPENGFNVAHALIGSESTLVTILEATLKLVKNPAHRSLVLLGYSDVYTSADHVPDVLPFKPIALEGIDDRLVNKLRKKGTFKNEALLPPGRGWLYVEFGGDTPQESRHQAEGMMTALRARPDAPSMKLYESREEEQEVWHVRESALGATAFVPGDRDTWEGWEDSAVEPAQLGAYLRELRTLYEKFNYEGAFYGHFGQGCLHTRVTFDLVTDSGLQNYRQFVDEAADLVIRYGGSLSGEHGDGQARGELLPKMFGPEMMKAFEAFKDLWDPANKMNPGKIIRPFGILEHLRLGTDYHPSEPKTEFAYPADQHQFSRAALRCVGVGKCRREEGGTMCPSYQVTREEQHSTRGRAHLLFEMLRGEVIRDGWKSEEVKEALDLCLSCKGCKSDCPVSVDMSTYKAEFLSHYYEGRLRPRSAYAFGFVREWSRLGSLVPRLANFFTQTPGLRSLMKWGAAIAPERHIPKLATETFTSWFRSRTPSRASKKLILWPDTFTTYYHPQIGIDAVEVLEKLGYEILLPPKPLCCGRPLYDYGFLGMARRRLQETIDHLGPWIDQGIPLIGLEPSCVSVFRDELPNLIGGSVQAKRLSQQTFLLGEFLANENVSLPPLYRKAIVQGHCHQKSVLDFKGEEKILAALGLELSIPEAGCCGMAGAFGFEADHFAVSMACGERALLPEARRADADTLVIANGFSCREQIRQGGGREALHLAQVLALALGRKDS